jgi:hypothetical protein
MPKKLKFHLDVTRRKMVEQKPDKHPTHLASTANEALRERLIGMQRISTTDRREIQSGAIFALTQMMLQAHDNAGDIVCDLVEAASYCLPHVDKSDRDDAALIGDCIYRLGEAMEYWLDDPLERAASGD